MLLRAFTDLGLTREQNEDSLLLCHAQQVIQISAQNRFDTTTTLTPPLLACVADGMGGHAGGEVASRLVCNVFGQAYATLSTESTPANAELTIRKTISQCLDEMEKQQSADNALLGMGTTLVGFFSGPCGNLIFHSGDSRAYGLHGKYLRPLTRDHNEQNKLLSLGVHIEHTGRGLNHCLGGGVRDDFVEITVLPAEHGYSAIFLCSDGVSEFCDEDILEESIATRHLDRIQANVLENGAGDNLTYIAVYFDAEAKT